MTTKNDELNRPMKYSPLLGKIIWKTMRDRDVKQRDVK